MADIAVALKINIFSVIKNYIIFKINYQLGDKMVSFDEFPITSADHVAGYKIVEVKGFVYGLTVRARGIGGDIGAGIKSILGGEIKQYVKMMEDSRDESINRCIDHAKELGANAIVTVRMDSDSISQNMQEVLTYGTAVVIEKE